jgi:hypothetical protein
MKPVYLDLHIHTSEDPENLNENYPIDTLISKIKELTNDSPILISLTDHNIINKPVYLRAKQKIENLLLGVELHIKNYADCPAYHCHIYFKCNDINEEIIDDLNKKLNKLYPSKVIRNDDANIPTLENVIKEFDSYEFILLPHGGQSHSTFDKSIPEGVQFDNTIERSIYYNQFDGFTARGNTGLETTQEYFRRLGINEFVNLVTSTDNYNPSRYPSAKASNAKPFVPTWMMSLPNFNGLRLSLSESSRLVYSSQPPSLWTENIKKVLLKRDKIDIDVELTPGLNVVIGGSSSGKTLFVDSVFRKISNDFQDSNYSDFEIEFLNVENPSGIRPHYLSQNYIMSVINKNTDEDINSIDIIKDVFPGDESLREKVDSSLEKLKSDLGLLVKCIKTIENESKKLSRIPLLTRLITTEQVKENILKYFLPKERDINNISYSEFKYKDDNSILDEIDSFLENNPLINHNKQLIRDLKMELASAFYASKLEENIRQIIDDEKHNYDEELKSTDVEEQSKKQHFDKLLKSIREYSRAYIWFKKVLSEIAEYSTKCESEEIISMGHKLYIQNDFKLDKDIFLEVINHYLKTGKKIDSFENITPERLFESNFKKQSPKVHNYDDFEEKVYNDFQKLNKKTYKIKTRENKDFENLSAGWKTSVILDLILGYENDIAPIIIDQPEDNLATNYINKGLVEAIKRIKPKKQVILVSHNATIPMLADAQNVVLCKNEEQKITIRSDRLEGQIENIDVVDHIAQITDGGKPSIKKRVKKYNLKKFKS